MQRQQARRPIEEHVRCIVDVALDQLAEKRVWLQRWAAFAMARGGTDENLAARAEALASRLPTLSPEREVALLEEAGFNEPRLFYAALSFRGWVAYAG